MKPKPMLFEEVPKEVIAAEEGDEGVEDETTVEQFFAESKGNTLYFSYATTNAKITIGITHDKASLEEMVKAAKELLAEFKKKKE
ncbi:hypothetical protein ADU37_CDS00920 [Thermococcus sp. 2319x1]|uniref:hypothetical protein n=1 Tax=Thermococcus sp. 2319x1 TaxID=1674923 RepID=UPI00073A64E5|nr:hypothetical protein [Thermococcus sp. 2319x1]ALV61791.1 hypothetical protein ADU37_CDS00920 [Thermococcus sp. 2319x1]